MPCTGAPGQPAGCHGDDRSHRFSDPRLTVPYGGGPGLTGSRGTGTTVIAAGGSSYVILAEGGCDDEVERQAQDAREQADEADRTADGAELADRQESARKALEDEGVQHAPRRIDEFVQRAKDDPDPDKKEIGKADAARALDEISKLAGTRNVSKEARRCSADRPPAPAWCSWTASSTRR